MKCHECGVQNPKQADYCMSCDASLAPADFDKNLVRTDKSSAERQPQHFQESGNYPANRSHQSPQAKLDDSFDERYGTHAPHMVRRSKAIQGQPRFQSLPKPVLWTGGAVALVLAGAAVFVLTKAPDDQRLYDQGQKEIANGQYAFAVATLSKASTLKTDDPKIQLALARAYIGIDQIDKAWDCISRAQKLGEGVSAQPVLATELANFYRRQGKFDKAIELLTPLAKAGIAGKKAELSDLVASYGDELLQQGKLEESLKCWEQVKDLREGSRFAESEARLSTIYQRLANKLASAKDDEQALAFLDKLNTIAQNPKNYEMAADIHVRMKKLDLAIDSMRKAITLSSKNPTLDKKLSDLLARRGKELVDEGNTESGLAYLQQAKELNPANAIPDAALRAVSVVFDSKQPSISGEIVNPSDKTLNSLGLKVELFDNANSKSLWEKEQKIVDSFTPPMPPHESRPFQFSAPMSAPSNGTVEFRTYINGSLYKSYLIGTEKDASSAEDAKHTTLAKNVSAKTDNKEKVKEQSPLQSTAKAVVPLPGSQQTPPPVVSKPAAPVADSSEEKTLKDLEP